MLKRYLMASVLAVALVFSAGVHQLRAECVMVVHCLVVAGASSTCLEGFWC